MTDITAELKEHAVFRNRENTERVIKCLNELDEEEIWLRPNTSSNSVGNLILHLCGNIRQYIISSLGKKEDTREREKEFSAEGGYLKEELVKLLINTINEANTVITDIPDSELMRKRNVQGYFFSGTGIIIHVVEHYSYHTGQIAFWTKQLKNKDLGFYAGKDLSVRNKD